MKEKSKNKIFRIVVLIIFSILILFGVAHYLNKQIKQKYFTFRNLKYDSIEYVALFKYNIKNKPDSIILSDRQTKTLIYKWNNSYPIGPCKFIPSFIVKVKLKNGSTRDFNYIKECLKENGWGYQFIFRGNFITKMWNK